MSPEQLQQLLSGDPARAARWIAASAAEGLLEAQLRLGRMLLEGVGVELDKKSAFFWFGRAAEAGSTDARNMVGRCFENGWGVPQDVTMAACHFLMAARAGHDWAQYNLGHHYLDGTGVERDPIKALAWYRRAAAQGHARALSMVGRCLEEGWGCAVDRAAAFDHYRRSAQAGYFRGQYNYASMLVQMRRIVAAGEWFGRAAAQAPLAVRREIALTLLASEHDSLHPRGLAVLAACCEDGGALDYYRYGRALASGRGGVPDPVQSNQWLTKAAQLRFESAVPANRNHHAAAN